MGIPFVFGRGGEEALALAAASIPFRVVPGITAGVAAPAYAGIPTTQRGVAQSVAFVTGHHAGGGSARDVDWSSLAKAADTLVLYMGLGQIAEITRTLITGGRSVAEPVAFLSDATTPLARRVVTTLGEAANAARAIDRSGPTLIVIGDTVDLHHILDPLQQTAPAVVNPETNAAPITPSAQGHQP